MTELTEPTNPNETVPGGKYIVGDNYVNAEGVVLGPVEKPKKAKDADDK